MAQWKSYTLKKIHSEENSSEESLVDKVIEIGISGILKENPTKWPEKILAFVEELTTYKDDLENLDDWKSSEYINKALFEIKKLIPEEKLNTTDSLSETDSFISISSISTEKTPEIEQSTLISERKEELRKEIHNLFINSATNIEFENKIFNEI